MPAKEKRDLISFIKDLIQYQRDRTNQPGFPSWSCMIQKKAGFLQRRKERENHQGTGRVRRSSKLSLSLLTQRVKKSFSMKRRPNPRVHQLSFFLLLLLLWPSSSAAAAFFGRLFGPIRRVGECHPCACLQCRAVTSRDMKSPLSFSLLLAWPPF